MLFCVMLPRADPSPPWAAGKAPSRARNPRFLDTRGQKSGRVTLTSSFSSSLARPWPI